MAAYLSDLAPSAAVRITDRPFAGEDDWHRIRHLMIETYPITPPAFNWEIRHWDGNRYHRGHVTLDDPQWQLIHLWETADGTLVGAAHIDGPGDAVLQVHPDYRALIEDAMIDWTMDHIRTAYEEDPSRERTDYYVYDYDAARRMRLEARGFEQIPGHGVTRRLRLGHLPLPPVSVAEGYTLRTTNPNDMADCQRIADTLNAAFNRDFHMAQDVWNFVQHAPCYRADLDLMMIAPDGTTLAAYVGVIYDEANRRGIFEPVCTHPDHRRKGLAQALMFEGLHRLRAAGATYVFVDTGSAVAANKLYQSIGFTEEYVGHVWRKVYA